jgi:RimJ/RimL family protein N-acetyltransferase
MQLEPVTLENRWVRLEPMGEAHKAQFRATCDADPEVFEALYPYALHGEHFEPAWTRIFGLPPTQRINFAVVVKGRCVGTTSYGRLEPQNATLEIGGTYYHPDFRGGATNPAAKRLLLDEAFARGARRVSFRVDAINARSRAAMLKLGAVEEGILRQDVTTWTGRIRDTVMFSILASEWPAVRDRLDQRLAAFG